MFLKKKIVNLIMINGQKFCSEKLLKKCLKSLLKNNKKNLILLVSIAISLTVYGFKSNNLILGKLKNRALKKLKPFFLTNKTKIILGLKFIVTLSKTFESHRISFLKNFKAKLLSFIIKTNNNINNQKINEHQQILSVQNMLIYYRY